MTNKEFWKKLDRITEKKQTFDTTIEFMTVLMQGYMQELEILVLGVESPDGQGLRQLCQYDGKEKVMIYFTDERHAKKCKSNLPIGSAQMGKCMSAYACDVIDNALDNPQIKGIIFNPDTENCYTIPTFLLAVRFSLIRGDLQ